MLSGKTAARLAQSVYALRLNDNVQAALAASAEGTALFDMFHIDDSAKRVIGQSGAVYRPATGFGLLLRRKGAVNQGEYVLAIRGTEFSSISDWLSNANVTLDRGPGGWPVHAGFNRVYRSMSRAVNEALAGKNITTLHVCGHSLGGALATLFAAEFAFNNKADVKLATFGAPRPAPPFFCHSLARKLGDANMRRVYTLADPVPMVPLWPFSHPPGAQYAVNANFGSITKDAHSMDEVYLDRMPDSGWPVPDRTPNYRNVDYWLQRANSASGPFSAMGYWALGKALQGILALAEAALGIVFVAGATLLDTLAEILVNAARVAALVGDLLLRFVRAAMRFLGQVASGVRSAAEITAWFLRSILNRIYSGVAAAARGAINRFS
ncbi:MAG: lipase family protein [Pseudomonadota bacterium]